MSLSLISNLYDGESDDYHDESPSEEGDEPDTDNNTDLEGEFKCPYCYEKFSEPDEMIQHLDTHEELDEEETKNDAHFDDDEDAKSKDKPNECHICHRSFEYPSYLQRHMASHSNTQPFKCTRCNFSTKYRKSLSRHLVTHEGLDEEETTSAAHSYDNDRDIDDNDNDNDDNPDSKQKANECHICHRSFEYPSYLQKHMIAHSNSRASNAAKKRKQGSRCKLCGASFLQPSYLRRHMLSHSNEKPWKCSLCNYASKHRQDLNKHLTLHSGEGRPWKCSTCGCSFKKSYALKTHINQFHKNGTNVTVNKTPPTSSSTCHEGSSVGRVRMVVKPKSTSFYKRVKCSLCSSTFTSRRNVSRHIRLVHLREWRFKCETCDKAFGTKHTLKSHISAVHKQEKPFDCPECARPFARKPDLRKHIWRMHRGRTSRLE